MATVELSGRVQKVVACRGPGSVPTDDPQLRLALLSLQDRHLPLARQILVAVRFYTAS